MYTELIFGAELSKGTPKSVIDSLKYMLGKSDKPKNFPLSRCEWLFQGASSYFGIDKPVNDMWHCEFSGTWSISTRGNIKNYNGEIEEFLKWIEPHIAFGSGNRDMYAIVTYEDSEQPEIFYLSE